MLTFFIIFAAFFTAAIGGLALLSTLIARRVEKALPPTGRFIDIDGHRLHYQDEGGHGPAVIMIHGLGGQMGHFSHSLLDRLAGRYRVILLDRPGSGYSTRPPGAPGGPVAQAAVVAGFIRALGLERPWVVGHSLGGAVALALALDHPDCVAGLALVAPLTHPQPEVPSCFRGLAITSPAIRWLVAWTLAVPLGILRGRTVLDTVFGPDPVPPDFGTRGGGLLGLRPGAFRGASADLVAAAADLPRMVERYGTLRLPIAILYGRGDQVLEWRRQGLAMRDRLPGVDLTLVDGGHMLPVAAAARMAEWLTGVTAPVRAGGQ
ncbi:alpha/beta fold hydrolase [Azospirillum sp. B4]|uniref:alpha/beta fold hydrolase n=1 Tax=Azospirillum sp. B4 TaxID=95605 RepID=UPI00034AF904|nr:alpha/beta hydrolase [Azospirillum sp. B4]